MKLGICQPVISTQIVAITRAQSSHSTDTFSPYRHANTRMTNNSSLHRLLTAAITWAQSSQYRHTHTVQTHSHSTDTLTQYRHTHTVQTHANTRMTNNSSLHRLLTAAITWTQLSHSTDTLTQYRHTLTVQTHSHSTDTHEYQHVLKYKTQTVLYTDDIGKAGCPPLFGP